MMVTTLHKLIGLSVALLGQAPGTDLLSQWTRLYTQSREDGLDAMAALQKVAQHILNSDAFEEVHPAFTIIDNQDFARQFLNQLLGETASAEVVTLVVGLLNSGTSRAEVAVRAVEYLLEVNHQGSDHGDYATFGSYATRFGNQVEVARYYTAELRWSTPNTAVLLDVTAEPSSVDTAKSRIDGMQRPGETFELTLGVDRLSGTLGDDIFVATEKTLTGADRVDGRQGMDNMELSGSDASADVKISSGARVTAIEQLVVDSGGDFEADLSNWDGLESVHLRDVEGNVELELDADDAVKVMSDSLGDDDKASMVTIENAGMVELAGVSKKATVKITGEGTESVMVEGGKGVKVDNDSVASVLFDGLSFSTGSTDPAAFSSLQDLTVDGVLKPGQSIGFHAIIESDAIAKLGVANTSAHILIKDNAGEGGELMLTVDKFGTDVTENLKIGTVVLDGAGAAERVMLEVAGDSFVGLASKGMLKTLEVSGAGALELRVQNGNAVSNNFYLPSGTLETLMLSNAGKFTMDAKGMSKLMTVDASDATGDVKIDNLGNSVTNYQGSMGKDTVSVAAFNAKGLMANLGDGDDTFTVDNLAAGKSKIDGGAGMDTLVLKQKVGANLKGASDSYRNFEIITLEAGGGKGNYDLKGLDIDELKISSSVGDKNGVKFINVTPGTDLAVSSPAGKNNLAVVNYMLESGQGSRFGSSNSTLNLHLHANGHKDDTAVQVKDARGVLMQLTVDDDIDTLVVDSTATPANKIKAGDYMNLVSIRGEDKIKQIKITGNAKTHLSHLLMFNYATDANGNAVAKSTEVDSNSKGLLALEYVDARESTGGVEIFVQGAEVHGSDVGDDIAGVWIAGNKATNYKDKLLGYGGDDFIAGGSGPDEITGGAGGDILTGGPSGVTSAVKNNDYFRAALTSTTGVFGINAVRDGAEDKFIYTAASDSQVDLSKMSGGFDVIVRFEASKDKIDLSKVVDLQGTIKDGNTKGGGGETAGKAFTANTDGNTLAKFIGDGNGVFETSASDRLDGTRHSIVLVKTKEDGFVDYKSRGSALDGEQVTWVLVDVDGDGDFAASTDMAIALVDIDGTISTSSTGIFM